MRHRLLGLCLLLTISLPLDAAHGFADVSEEHWFAPYVEELSSHGIVAGNPDGTFTPNASLTRAELAKIAVLLGEVSGSVTGQEEILSNSFLDVDATSWYAPHVQKAQAAGLMRGYTNAEGIATGLFKPEQAVTRAEAVKVLVAATGVGAESHESPTFTDVPKDAWFAGAITTANTLHIVDGYRNTKGKLTGAFGPHDTVTRAQIAKMATIALDPPAYQ